MAEHIFKEPQGSTEPRLKKHFSLVSGLMVFTSIIRRLTLVLLFALLSKFFRSTFSLLRKDCQDLFDVKFPSKWNLLYLTFSPFTILHSSWFTMTAYMKMTFFKFINLLSISFHNFFSSINLFGNQFSSHTTHFKL